MLFRIADTFTNCTTTGVVKTYTTNLLASSSSLIYLGS